MSATAVAPRDLYDFLDTAYRELADGAADDDRVALMVRALVALGLGAPARELLATPGLGPRTAALRHELAGAPTGRAPWTALAGTFEANLEALDDPAAAARLREAVRRTQLFRSLDGNLHPAVRDGSGQRRWLRGLVDHRALEMPAEPDGASDDSWLLFGLPTGEFVERLYESTARDDAAPVRPLYLLEPCWSSLAAWLHERDRTTLLADPRVLLLAGPDAETQMTARLRDQIDLPLPSRLSAPYADAATVQRLQLTCRAAAEERATRHRACVARIEARPVPPLAPGARILGFTSRFTTMLQHSMRDIGTALSSLGYDMRIEMEAAPHRQLSGALLSHLIERHDPALVILINHLRCEVGSAYGRVPLLTWIQDPMTHLLTPEAGASVGPLDFVCGFYRRRCIEQLGYPADRFFGTVVPVSTRVFHDAPLPPEHRECTCDVMYVGHLHATAPVHLAEWRRRTPASLHQLLDDLQATIHARHQAGEHLGDPLPLVREAAERRRVRLQPQQVEQLGHYFAYRLYDILFRQETLRWVAAWAARTGRSFRLYGRGWENDPLLAPHAVGPVEHGEPLRSAYRGARIAIQTLPAGFMHQRSFEGLASGTLVVARWVPPSFGGLTVEQFRRTPVEEPPRSAATRLPGLDRVMFDGPESLADLLDRYLDDEVSRTAVAAELQAAVLDRFTYPRVLDDVLGRIRKHLAASGR